MKIEWENVHIRPSLTPQRCMMNLCCLSFCYLEILPPCMLSTSLEIERRKCQTAKCYDFSLGGDITSSSKPNMLWMKSGNTIFIRWSPFVPASTSPLIPAQFWAHHVTSPFTENVPPEAIQSRGCEWKEISREDTPVVVILASRSPYQMNDTYIHISKVLK